MPDDIDEIKADVKTLVEEFIEYRTRSEQYVTTTDLAQFREKLVGECYVAFVEKKDYDRDMDHPETGLTVKVGKLDVAITGIGKKIAYASGIAAAVFFAFKEIIL